jgi:hypothetical protein
MTMNKPALSALFIATMALASTAAWAQTDLSPDQKLARAYALCAKSSLDGLLQAAIHNALPDAPLPVPGSLACHAIMTAYEQSHEHQSEADRAFIEEVARGLK